VAAAGLSGDAGGAIQVRFGLLAPSTQHRLFLYSLTLAAQLGLSAVFVFRNASGLRQELEVQASTDSLTGLLNRRAIRQTAEREILLAGLQRQSISAILIDLDGFKQINDSYGHQCGDAVLIEVARCLKSNMRRQDHLARLGGDEFVTAAAEHGLGGSVHSGGAYARLPPGEHVDDG